MVSEKLTDINKKILIELLLNEDYKSSKIWIAQDSQGIYHLDKQVCTPNSLLKEESDLLSFIDLDYCADCLNVLTLGEFSLPSQAIIKIMGINQSLRKYLSDLDAYITDYDILLDLQTSLNSYKLFTDYHRSDYQNSSYFYNLYQQYLDLDQKITELLKLAYARQRELISKKVVETFFSEFQPGLWDLETKYPSDILSSPLPRLTQLLAQEFYYFWVDRNFSDAVTDTVNLFFQNKLTESKLKNYQVSNVRSLRGGLNTLLTNWVKEYKTLSQSKTLMRAGVNLDLSEQEPPLIQTVILAFSFYSEKNKHLLELPKIVGLYLREVLQSDPSSDNRNFCFNILPHYTNEELIEGSKLWDPSGSGPLKNLEAAIISAKLINSSK